uniref:Uncharacterized protein n=1 Tax=Rhizophora mucronata TaxID=61149 RepID=A0A2P2KG81_RHIMU
MEEESCGGDTGTFKNFANLSAIEFIFQCNFTHWICSSGD